MPRVCHPTYHSDVNSRRCQGATRLVPSSVVDDEAMQLRCTPVVCMHPTLEARRTNRLPMTRATETGAIKSTPFSGAENKRG